MAGSGGASAPASRAPGAGSDPPRRSRGTPGRDLARRAGGVVRWLHLYLSLAAFGTMLLFSVTGLSLNHPEWFGAGEPTIEDLEGTLDAALVGGADADDDPGGATVDRLAVAETLRARHALRGAVADFRSDPEETTVAWKGPGYAADAVIIRRTGRYRLTVARHGLVDILNDLHKGRDTGPLWSAVIDVSAGILVAVAVTGLLLVCWIRRRRLAGLFVALVGTLAVLAAAAWFVP